MSNLNNQYEHLVIATNALNLEGYITQFSFENGKLLSHSTKVTYLSDQVTVNEFHRFEGISNPSDQSIIYAISTSNEKGTIIDSYDANASRALSLFLGKCKVNATT